MTSAITLKDLCSSPYRTALGLSAIASELYLVLIFALQFIVFVLKPLYAVSTTTLPLKLCHYHRVSQYCTPQYHTTEAKVFPLVIIVHTILLLPTAPSISAILYTQPFNSGRDTDLGVCASFLGNLKSVLPLSPLSFYCFSLL